MTEKMLRGAIAAVAVATVFAGVTAAGAAGRYKKEGNRCVWNARDTGPDQCHPVLAGHFKKSGDRCTWAANERGGDECRPRTGRFKRNGRACEWNATDKGPDQCNPRQAR